MGQALASVKQLHGRRKVQAEMRQKSRWVDLADDTAKVDAKSFVTIEFLIFGLVEFFYSVCLTTQNHVLIVSSFHACITQII